jgi:uncharacterized Tic20 family protein
MTTFYFQNRRWSTRGQKGRGIMLVLVLGLLGFFLIPFVVLLGPLFLWLVAPTLAGLAIVAGIRAMRRHQPRLEVSS